MTTGKLDLTGLPDALLKQLVIRDYKPLAQVVQIIMESKSPISLDEAMIALYRKHGVIVERRDALSAVYRGVRRGAIQAFGDKQNRTYAVVKPGDKK